MTLLDADGQPNPLYNRARRADRDTSEMLGLVKGVLADGEVNEAEVLLLRDWVIDHPDACEMWPARVILERLYAIFQDGVVDESERRDLAALLRDLVGGNAGILVGETAATTLPIDDPPPGIVFDSRVFVLTGKFALGPRPACALEVENLGGVVDRSITKRTDYLVVGTFGSRDWAHTSYGRKIEKAVRYRDRHGLAIVGEDHWANAI